jgi:hypothetical protein
MHNYRLRMPSAVRTTVNSVLFSLAAIAQSGIRLLAFRRLRVFTCLSPTEPFRCIFPLRDGPNDSLLPSASPESETFCPDTSRHLRLGGAVCWQNYNARPRRPRHPAALSVSSNVPIGLPPNGDRNHLTKLDHFVFLWKKKSANRRTAVKPGGQPWAPLRQRMPGACLGPLQAQAEICAWHSWAKICS